MSDSRLLDHWKNMVSRLKETWDELTEIEIEEDRDKKIKSIKPQERNKTMKNQAILTTIILTTLLAGCDVFHDRETVGEYVDDTGITGSISSAIIQEPSLSKLDIHVETFKDRVQLSGFVRTREQARLAESIARDTIRRNTTRNSHYNRRIVNNIVVRP